MSMNLINELIRFDFLQRSPARQGELSSQPVIVDMDARGDAGQRSNNSKGNAMFEFLSNNPADAIGLLKQDHTDLKDMFDKFEKSADFAEKEKVAADALQLLKIHAAIEEEIFYPALDGKIDTKVLDEADEEHHIAHLLIAELEQMGANADRFAAKFKVLAESVRHHIKEEENVMMPQAEDALVDLMELGRQMQSRRKELEASGKMAMPIQLPSQLPLH